MPTYSALNITPGGTAALRATYSPGTNVGTPFINFRTAARQNEGHIEYTALNSTWMLQELRQTPQVLSCAAFCAALPTIGGPDVICDGNGSTFTLAGLPPGTTVNWVVGASVPYTQVAASNAAYTVTIANGFGVGTILATLTSDCGSFTVSKQVALGKPNPTMLNTAGPGEPTFCVFTAPPVLGAAYQWYVDNRPVADATDSEFSYYFGCRVTHVISYAFVNDCVSPSTRPSVSVTGDCKFNNRTAALYPNPAKETVDVHIENASPDAPVTVRLFDGYGRPHAEQTSTGAASVRLATDKLPAGLYFVHILRGREVLSRQQLRIEH